MCSKEKLVTVTVELKADSDPIAGRLRVDGQSPRDFIGWVDFAAAIQLALTGSRRSDLR